MFRRNARGWAHSLFASKRTQKGGSSRPTRSFTSKSYTPQVSAPVISFGTAMATTAAALVGFSFSKDTIKNEHISEEVVVSEFVPGNVPKGLQAEAPLRSLGSVYASVPELSPEMPMREKMEILLKFYQKEIIAGIEQADSSGKKFLVDEWTRGSGGGGGITRVFQDGIVFEKGGVNFSAIHGKLPPAAALRMRANHKELVIPESGELPFYACGLSLVIHPRHYLAPSVHLNYRYFETRKEDGSVQSWWFGGGQDLSPMYFDEHDAIHFHRLLKDVCDYHDPTYYSRFKKWADEYFFIKFRGEARGIGGIFFDDLNDKDPELIFKFVGDGLSRFLPSYLPAVRRSYEVKNRPMPTPEEGKFWQGLRRGRYVEFNLAVDRGTQFGLQTPGSRVESILMTLPKTASWEYNYHPEPGTLEAETVEVLKNARDYV
ncbi:Coproporphyrinogen III oxidase [Dipodascopsis uninucleata]